MHETLEKFLIKWMKTISTTFKNNKFSEYDMKPARPSNEKDVKPARKSNRKTKKSKKRDTDKDNKPDTNKDIKPDTDKDIKPNKKILLKIIQNNIRILNRINTYLSKSLKMLIQIKIKNCLIGYAVQINATLIHFLKFQCLVSML